MNKDRPEDKPSPDHPQDEKATGGGVDRLEPAPSPAGEPKFDRVRYMRDYMRRYRTRKRLEKAEESE